MEPLQKGPMLPPSGFLLFSYWATLVFGSTLLKKRSIYSDDRPCKKTISAPNAYEQLTSSNTESQPQPAEGGKAYVPHTTESSITLPQLEEDPYSFTDFDSAEILHRAARANKLERSENLELDSKNLLQLGALQRNLAEILLTKYNQNSALRCKAIPWESCLVVGLPADIDLSNTDHIRWALMNICRIRIFPPDQCCLASMFSQDLARLPPLDPPFSDAAITASLRYPNNCESIDPSGLDIELKCNTRLYTFTHSDSSRIKRRSVKVNNDMSDAERWSQIKLAVRSFHLRLLKDLGVNTRTFDAQKIIVIGVPPCITLADNKKWTFEQFQKFLSHYYRIRAFHLNQANLAERYAEEVQALPPPPFVSEFSVFNEELSITTDKDGRELREKWNNVPIPARNSDARNDSATTLHAGALLRDSQIRLKLCDAFYKIFMKKFRREASPHSSQIYWRHQPHAGYPFEPHWDFVIYFSEHGMELFLRYYHRIRFFRDDQMSVRGKYIERLKELPPPPPLHFERLSDILSLHSDKEGIDLQKEFDEIMQSSAAKHA